MNRKIPGGDPAAPEEAVPSRRVVLRGAFAAGCGLLFPGLLGCEKKEPTGAPEPAAPEPAAPAAPGPAAEQAAPAPAKVSQASVQYQTQPKGDQKCADCLHFIAESNTCKLVEGNISPNGWCVLWARKA
jgi:hypothetical protein